MGEGEAVRRRRRPRPRPRARSPPRARRGPRPRRRSAAGASRAQVELAADHRGHREDVADARRPGGAPAGPTTSRTLVGQARSRRGRPSCAQRPSSSWRERAGLGEVPEHLGGEERVAAGLAAHGVRQGDAVARRSRGRRGPRGGRPRRCRRGRRRRSARRSPRGGGRPGPSVMGWAAVEVGVAVGAERRAPRRGGSVVTRWRSSSTVGLSAQCRSSSTSTTGVRRRRCVSTAPTALEEQVALGLGVGRRGWPAGRGAGGGSAAASRASSAS